MTQDNCSEIPKLSILNEKRSRPFEIEDIPVGQCMRCGVYQTKPAEGGFWIHGGRTDWLCCDCKYAKNGPKIRRNAFACEWCTYEDVTFYQLGTYDCPRCKELNIGQAKIF